MHSVILLTNPEYNIARIKTERLFTSVWCRNQSNFFCLNEIPLSWKAHFPHGRPLPASIQSERMVYGQEEKVSEARDKLFFLVTSASARFVIKTADDRKHKFMNQEWYCTSKAIAQIMIVFTSIYNELNTQIRISSKLQ